MSTHTTTRTRADRLVVGDRVTTAAGTIVTVSAIEDEWDVPGRGYAPLTIHFADDHGNPLHYSWAARDDEYQAILLEPCKGCGGPDDHYPDCLPASQGGTQPDIQYVIRPSGRIEL